MAAAAPPTLSPREREALRRLWGAFGRTAATPRRRRLLLLALSAPGFIGVFSTPLHRSPGLLAVGALLFTAAMVFRIRTEPLFLRAEAAGHWPPSTKELPHA